MLTCAFLLPGQCLAIDFSIQVSEGYTLSKINNACTALSSARSRSIIFATVDYSGVGPVTEYATTTSHIFLHTIGKTPRDAFEGDTFGHLDWTANFYFLIDTSDDSVLGPFQLDEFERHPVVQSLGPDEPEWHPFEDVFTQVVFWLVCGCPTVLVLLTGLALPVWYLVRMRRRERDYLRPRVSRSDL